MCVYHVTSARDHRVRFVHFVDDGLVLVVVYIRRMTRVLQGVCARGPTQSRGHAHHTGGYNQAVLLNMYTRARHEPET